MLASEQDRQKSRHEAIPFHGWMVIMTIFMADAICLGGRALFLIVILLFEEEFGWNRGSLSALMAVVRVEKP